jgi:hypothetical protein
MLRVNLYPGTSADDICDYCKKQNGEEVISLQVSGRTYSERQSIQIHTKCLTRQIQKIRDQKFVLMK